MRISEKPSTGQDRNPANFGFAQPLWSANLGLTAYVCNRKLHRLNKSLRNSLIIRLD
jgi:hypothetical protein